LFYKKHFLNKNYDDRSGGERWIWCVGICEKKTHENSFLKKKIVFPAKPGNTILNKPLAKSRGSTPPAQQTIFFLKKK